MNTVEVVTPSNHKVFIKESLTYGEKKQLRKFLTSHIEIDLNANNSDTTKAVQQAMKGNMIKADIMLDYQDKALELSVIRIIDQSGIEHNQNILEYINNMSEKDGETIMSRVRELHLTEKPEGEKKSAESTPF